MKGKGRGGLSLFSFQELTHRFGRTMRVLATPQACYAFPFCGTPASVTENGPQAQDAPRPPAIATTHATIVPRQDHPISRKAISSGAMKVLYRLLGAGHQAFLVGGGVRDLLLGGEPKDFDVATDAAPEVVRDLFSNAQLIGRRFKLVHVRFGREIVEVATFRALSDGTQAPTVAASALPKRRDRHSDEPASALSEEGMILRDNVYGTIEDDALRRDFTINALYYTPADFAIYDFAGGLKDLKARQLRLIGEPEGRYREDPVRMLRAIRFAAKLDFTVELATEAAIAPVKARLLDVPAARLFDEVGKLFLHGHGVKSLTLLRQHGLFGLLFPEVEAAFQAQPSALALAEAALASTDSRIVEGKPVTPAFLLAAFLWAPLQTRASALKSEGLRPLEALQEAMRDVLHAQQQHTTIPRRLTTFMQETWTLQSRLQRGARRAEKLVLHPRFRAAYDFLVLREGVGEATEGMGAWWTAYQADRETPVPHEHPAEGRRPRRRRRRRGPNQGGEA